MEDGVLVTNINPSAEEKDMRAFFGQFGTVSSLNLQPDKFNEGCKICYIKFTTPEGASNFVKKADRSTIFGEPIKVAFKKFTERNSNKVVNGVYRTPSTGFGRGVGLLPNPTSSGTVVGDVIILKNLILPIEKKCIVEIIELKSLTNILIRPLILTEKFRSNLCTVLEKVNENADLLASAKVPEIGGFYLAKWTEDNKFYRAKILNKLPENKFEVCFVDEGTTGDIVTELKVIPDNLLEIPCQFLPCAVNCNDSPELIDLVLKEGSDSEISIYVVSASKVNDKDIISIFIDDKDIIDIYKSKYNTDPRKESMPNKHDITAYKLDAQLSNCKLIKNTKETNHVTIVVNSTRENMDSAKLKALSTSPIPNDLLMYNENGKFYRCVINSCKYVNDQLNYSVNLVDENRSVNTVFANLLKSTEINYPLQIIHGVLSTDYNDAALYTGYKTVFLYDYDKKKDLYVVNMVNDSCKEKEGGSIRNEVISSSGTKVGIHREGGNLISGTTNHTMVGQTKSATLSHVESGNEFYVQFADELSLMTLEKIQNEINSASYKVSGFSDVRELKINQVVVAPYLSVIYRAIVRDVDSGKNCALLYFMDFGNSDWIVGNEVKKALDNVAHIDALAHRCKLTVGITDGQEGVVGELLSEYCDNGEAVVHVTVEEDDNDNGGHVLSVTVTADHKSGLADLLASKGLVAQRKVLAHDTTKNKEALCTLIRDLEGRISKLEAFIANK